MMRKYSVLFLTLIVGVFLNVKTYAFVPFDYTPLQPSSPQFCAQCIAADIPLVLGYIEQAKALKDRYMSYLNASYWKQKFTAYALRMVETAFSTLVKRAKREKFLSYSRTIKKASIADVGNEEEVKEAFIKLFLQYPSAKPSKMAQYVAMGRQFQIDTTMEVLLSTQKMSEEINKMKTDLDGIEKCLMQGQDCEKLNMQNCSTADSDDNSCMWNNAVRAVLIYDKVMRYNEYIIAMTSQYKAVQGIDSLARIRPYELRKTAQEKKSKDKTSFLMPSHQHQPKSFYAEKRIVASFADETLETNDDENDEEMQEYFNDLATKRTEMLGNFENPKPAAGFTTGLDGKDEDLEGQDQLAKVQENLDEAKLMHNMKQNLPEYRRIFESYHDMETLYQRALQNFQDSTQCTVNMLGKYYTNPVKAWFGRNCQMQGSGMTCHYDADDTAHDPSTIGSSVAYNVDCPDDKSKTCYHSSLDNFEVRKGINGYLLALYDTAKEEDVSSDVESAEVVSEGDDEDTFQENATNKITEDASIYISEKDGEGDGSLVPLGTAQKQIGSKTSDDNAGESKLKDPAMEEQLAIETRKDELLPWTSGFEVMREIEHDVNSKEGKFGTIKQTFPLWNDQIVFYDQYINGKYENIKFFVNNAPFANVTLDLAEAINKTMTYAPLLNESGMIIKAAETIRTEDGKSIRQARADLAQADKNAEEKPFIHASHDDVRAKADEYKKQQKDMEEHRSELWARLKVVNEQLSDARDEYNQANKDIKTAETTTARSQQGEEYGAHLYGKRPRSKSPQDKEFENQQADNDKIKIKALVTKRDAENTMRLLEKEAASIKKEIEDTEKAIETAKANYVKAYSSYEIALRQGDAEQAEDAYVQKDLQYIDELAQSNLSVSMAQKVVSCVREYAQAKVNKATSDIDNLRADKSLYYGEQVNKLHSIHKKMIEEISDISATAFSSESMPGCEVVSQVATLVSVLSTENVMQPVYDVFKNLCADDYCIKEDEEYFVGIPGKKRDFRAPKSALDFSSAPLREVFHFDESDYEQIDKYVADEKNIWSNRNVTVTAKSFLESGLDIPAVWRYILQEHSYVEKDFDLAELFGKEEETAKVNASNEAFLRAGTYPCQTGEWFVDVAKDGRKFGYIVENRTGGLNQCREVAVDKKKVIDLKTNKKTYSAPKSEYSAPSDRVSELSTILAYIPDETEAEFKSRGLFGGFALRPKPQSYKLSFNSALQTALQIIADANGIGDDPQKDSLFYMSQRAFLARNQFGDYLNQYEIISEVKETMEELAEDMMDVRTSLLAVVESTDFTLREDFDLTIEEDYKTIQDILKKQKEIFMNLAKTGLADIKSTTDTLNQKLEKVYHMVDVLEKDNQEVVAIFGDEDLDELEEKIKNRQANSAVADEYGKAVKESDAGQELVPPYCATY